MTPWTVEVLTEQVPGAEAEDLTRIVEAAARACLDATARPPCEVAVTLTDDANIAALNQTYRQVATPTDVLSFPLDDEAGLNPDGPSHLGDVVISIERARAQATDYGHGVDRELAFLTVHGVLHLLGYEHDTPSGRRRMRAREEAILARMGLTR